MGNRRNPRGIPISEKDLAGFVARKSGRFVGRPLAVLVLLRCGCGFSVAIFVAEHGLARKLDLVAFLADAFDENLLTFLQFITNIANATIGDLRDVQQSIRARKDFDERAKVNYTADR